MGVERSAFLTFRLSFVALSINDHSMELLVKVVPNANRSEIIGWEQDPRAGAVLRVRVAAPPAEGKANAALISLLSEWLQVSKSRIRLQKGEGSRIKTFDVPEIDLPKLGK